MPKPDWTGQRPLPETPADTIQPPLPTTNGWSQWIEGQTNDLKTAEGRTDDPVIVLLQVERGTETFWYALDGDTPKDWETEPVTAEVQEPEYRDFRRFRRFYPRIVLAAYIEVKVRLVLQFANPNAVFEKNTVMYERTGETKERRGFYIYRWQWTSWINDYNGQAVKIQDDTPPGNETVVPGRYDDLGGPPDAPPEDMRKPKPRPSEGDGKLYFASASLDGWRSRAGVPLEGEQAAWAAVAKGKGAPKNRG